MFEPIRGGTRGGQAEFKWSDVSADKDRENYLGHSINAPTGRWQKNKDVHWYNRDVSNSEAERLEEIRKVKEAEAEALSVALGFAPNAKGAVAKDEPTPSTSKPVENATSPDQTALDKEERRRRKAERKEEKKAKKELRRLERQERHTSVDTRRRREHSSSRSRSPRTRSRERRDYDDRYPRRRSRSPATPPYRDQYRISPEKYDDISRERERDRDRRRWDANSRRNEPGARWGRE
ncbi:kinase phosphorylation protein-domain-containing protein [Desarmillaria tabescens]|uniref:Kinase phosphorylation protein-domain-containing protein n=1 Tax=Armillaria tabescens TaxID=1929756 RepID=A0AA39TTU5_ARMTA|nr:kinase phosphorylation protein-domain-containing protein [Desarmillaria tabescens]KAK0469992.1 kinase phosphorylation protein-domain-containing protein [Desarmillaria tabescens]